MGFGYVVVTFSVIYCPPMEHCLCTCYDSTERENITCKRYQKLKRRGPQPEQVLLTIFINRDAIGVPRGVPNKYKAEDQIAAGLNLYCACGVQPTRIGLDQLYLLQSAAFLNCTQDFVTGLSGKISTTAVTNNTGHLPLTHKEPSNIATIQMPSSITNVLAIWLKFDVFIHFTENMQQKSFIMTSKHIHFRMVMGAWHNPWFILCLAIYYAYLTKSICLGVMRCLTPKPAFLSNIPSDHIYRVKAQTKLFPERHLSNKINLASSFLGQVTGISQVTNSCQAVAKGSTQGLG